MCTSASDINTRLIIVVKSQSYGERLLHNEAIKTNFIRLEIKTNKFSPDLYPLKFSIKNCSSTCYLQFHSSIIKIRFGTSIAQV